MYGYLYLGILYNFYAIKFLLYEKYEMLQEKRTHPETPMSLSETLFLLRNAAFSCPWKHPAMIVSLYSKSYMYFFFVIFALRVL